LWNLVEPFIPIGQTNFNMLNSRQLTLEQAARFFVRLIFWLPVVFFSLLLVRNTIPYYSFNSAFIFIEERALLFAKPVYYWSFYLHIGAGMFCILAALIQFSTYIVKKRFIHEFFCKRKFLGKSLIHVYGHLLVYHYLVGFKNHQRKKCTGA
jgi:hypothetical protein